MARTGGPKDYHEPWIATRSTAHGPCPTFREGSTMLEEVRQTLLDAWGRADQNAPWIVWGSRVGQPHLCTNLDGSVAVLPDRQIIFVARNQAFPEGSPDQEEFATRIAACVNAMAGIARPESFLTEVRSLLKDLVLHQADGEDGRILSLLSRCIPPDEIDRYAGADDE